LGAKRLATYMEVGPSAAPMIPMLAASLISNPKPAAITIVTKIPNWAAAPKRSIKGFFNKGVKSIIAPIAMKINRGNNSVSIPALKRTPSGECSPTAAEKGILAKIVPKPIGNNNVGS